MRAIMMLHTDLGPFGLKGLFNRHGWIPELADSNGVIQARYHEFLSELKPEYPQYEKMNRLFFIYDALTKSWGCVSNSSKGYYSIRLDNESVRPLLEACEYLTGSLEGAHTHVAEFEYKSGELIDEEESQIEFGGRYEKVLSQQRDYRDGWIEFDSRITLYDSLLGIPVVEGELRGDTWVENLAKGRYRSRFRIWVMGIISGVLFLLSLFLLYRDGFFSEYIRMSIQFTIAFTIAIVILLYIYSSLIFISKNTRTRYAKIRSADKVIHWVSQ